MVSAKGLYKLISSQLILSKGWLFALGFADSRNTLCWFQLTLRYTSISTKARWDFLKLPSSCDHFCGEVLTNLLIVRALIQYEATFGGMSFVACWFHIVETCSLYICSSPCHYLWEQLILLSLNLFFKPLFKVVVSKFLKIL